MNVYLLEANKMLVTYGEDYACVVIASDEQHARLIANALCEGQGVNWNKEEDATCTVVDLHRSSLVLKANVGS